MTENGDSKYWVRWLIGILWGIITLVLVSTVNNVIANDKDARERDKQICEQVQCDKKEQSQINQNILIALAEIKTDLKYIKEVVKK